MLLKSMKIVMLLVMTQFFLVSSGCDKDKNPTEPKNDVALVGLWELILYSTTDQGQTTTFTEEQIKAMGITWTFNIKADGSIEQKSNFNSPPTTYSGTWKTEGKTLTVNMHSDKGERLAFAFDYSLSGNILKLTWQIPNGPTLYSEFRRQES